VKTFLNNQVDKVNLYACNLFVDHDRYLQSYASEPKHWYHLQRQFKDKGTLKKIAEVTNIDENLFDYLGFKFSVGMAFYLVTVRQFYPMEELGLVATITEEEWTDIENVIDGY
jgi:hypothetical protein